MKKEKVDIMAYGPVKKRPEIVMFEVNDKCREQEYGGRSSWVYRKPFAAFIESLGYEVEIPEHSNHLIINGCKLSVLTDSATYACRSAYKRKVTVRKPDNRFVALSYGSFEDKNSVRVYVNKEMDADKLRKRIDAAITWNNDRDKYFKDVEATNERNTVDIGRHYFADAAIRSSVRNIYINQGTITFDLKTKYSLVVSPDNQLISLSDNSKEYKGESTIDSYFDVKKLLGDRTKKLIKLILSKPAISIGVHQWINECYHRYFYSETMSTTFKGE